MTAGELILELRRAGIGLSVDDAGNLHCHLSPELHVLPWAAKGEIEKHRQALIAVLSVRPLSREVLRAQHEAASRGDLSFRERETA